MEGSWTIPDTTRTAIGLPPQQDPQSTTPGRFSAVLWQSHESCLGIGLIWRMDPPGARPVHDCETLRALRVNESILVRPTDIVGTLPSEGLF